jgi:hypothetical protein
MNRREPNIRSRSFLASGLLIGITAALLACLQWMNWTWENGRYAISDDGMTGHFHAHQRDYEHLVRAVVSYSSFGGAHGPCRMFADRLLAAMNGQEKDDIRRSLAATDTKAISRCEEGIRLVYKDRRLEKGYVYSEDALEPIRDSLEFGVGYREISHPWYLYQDINRELGP